MTTAADLVSYAYSDAGLLGLGQTLSGNLAQEGLIRMNRMIYQWSRKRWNVFHLQDVSKVSTGATSYTIGAGGDFNCTRPARLEGGCFLRQNPTGVWVDYPMRVITSWEEFSSITLKTLTGPSAYVFLDSGYPLGTVKPYPVPQASIYEIHLAVLVALQVFAALTDVVVMPPEYEQAIQQNLAVLIRKARRLPDDPVLMGLASGSLNTIKNANAQIPTLTVPKTLLRPRMYNYLSDTSY